MTIRIESALSAVHRWCIHRWILAPAAWQKFWLARSKVYRAVSGRARGEAGRLFRLLSGIEDLHPESVGRLFDTGATRIVSPPAGGGTPLAFLPQPIAIPAACDFASWVIHSEIGPWHFFASDYIRKLGNAKRVFVGINSPGGDTDTALQMFDALQNRQVEVEIVGKAFSCAALLAMSGAKRRIARGATVMIHTPVAYAAGDVSDLRFQADNLEKLCHRCMDIYQHATGQPRCVVEQWFDGRDYYFSAENSVKAGLCHEVFDPAPAPQPIAPMVAAEPVPEDPDADTIRLTVELLERLRCQFKDPARFKTLLEEVTKQ